MISPDSPESFMDWARNIDGTVALRAVLGAKQVDELKGDADNQGNQGEQDE